VDHLRGVGDHPSGPLQSDPPQGNDKTIDGRGADITLDFSNGSGPLYINGVHNWIIHKIKSVNSSDPATNGAFNIRILCSHTVWIDHYDTTGGGTQTSIGIGVGGGNCYGPDNLISTNITISWSKFHDYCYLWTPYDAPNCSSGHILFSQGSPPNPPFEYEMVDARLTLHHNWYTTTANARFPLMRWGWAHAFNNYMDNTNQGTQVRAGGQFLSENDIYQCDGYSPAPGAVCGKSGNVPRIICYSQSGEAAGGNCKATNPWRVTGTETFNQLNTGTIFTPPYSYTLETADATLRSKITDPNTGAGAVPNPYNYQGELSAPRQGELSAPRNLRVVTP
jgi:pectate lyase